jgi:hypothetical protein
MEFVKGFRDLEIRTALLTTYYLLFTIYQFQKLKIFVFQKDDE